MENIREAFEKCDTFEEAMEYLNKKDRQVRTVFSLATSYRDDYFYGYTTVGDKYDAP